MSQRNLSPPDKPIAITGMGHFHPETVLTNSFFETLNIDTQHQWIEERTGIKERRSILTLDEIVALREQRTTISELRRQGRIMTVGQESRPAWEMSLKRRARLMGDTTLSPDLVLCGTSVPDFDIPANACSIAASLGLECVAFDVNSACSSFVANLHVASSLMAAGRASRAVVFTPERYTTRVNYGDRASAVLWGDGAASAILEFTDRPGTLALIDTWIASTPAKFDSVQIPEGGFFSQDGPAVQKFANSRTVEIAKKITAKHGLSPKQLRFFVAHQANLRMLQFVSERLGLSSEQHIHNVELFGNQGAAGAPSTLSSHWDRLNSGDHLVMAVVGSGLTWAAALFRVQ